MQSENDNDTEAGLLDTKTTQQTEQTFIDPYSMDNKLKLSISQRMNKQPVGNKESIKYLIVPPINLDLMEDYERRGWVNYTNEQETKENMGNTK